MKPRFIQILMLLWVFIATACSKDDTVKINVSQPNITDVPSEGGSYDIKVDASDTWVIKNTELPWLTVARYEKSGEQYLHIEVESNISEQARALTIELMSRNSLRNITIQQQAKPAGEELKYRLPIVFHVLYRDVDDKDQNIDAERIHKTLQEVNELYARNNINLVFAPATIDPSGNVMSEPGIDRIRWVSERINPIKVMSEEDNEYLHLLWDPNRYINVLLYAFDIPNILGIATFPLTPEHLPMAGLDQVMFSNLQVSDMRHLRGVSINSSWFRKQSEREPFQDYVSESLLAKQTSISTTLAHELGHYLGLRHVFSEGAEGTCVDTDYCEDTPSYDKNGAYQAFVAQMMSDAEFNPNFKNEFRWESLFRRMTCDGESFESRNIMDYSFGYMDTFTADQKERIRHVLHYSPFIPGPKKAVISTLRGTALPMRPLHLPHSIVVCRTGVGQPQSR